MVLANIALLSHQEPKQIATIAQRSLKLINTLSGIKYFRKMTPQTLYKMSKRDFQHLINSIEEALNGFSAFSFGGMMLRMTLMISNDLPFIYFIYYLFVIVYI